MIWQSLCVARSIQRRYKSAKMHFFSSPRITDQSVDVYVLISGYEMIRFEIKVLPLYPKLQSYLKMFFYIINLLFDLDFYMNSPFPPAASPLLAHNLCEFFPKCTQPPAVWGSCWGSKLLNNIYYHVFYSLFPQETRNSLKAGMRPYSS